MSCLEYLFDECRVADFPSDFEHLDNDEIVWYSTTLIADSDARVEGDDFGGVSLNFTIENFRDYAYVYLNRVYQVIWNLILSSIFCRDSCRVAKNTFAIDGSC